MTTIDGSDSPQYFVYRPPPDNLSRRQLDDYFQGVFVADLRSVFALVNNLQKQIRVVYVRTTLGATPSGTGVPDLRRAYPRQGISRRSCMLMRRILLKVERGVRRRVCQLGSCLHTPGADQSSASSIPCSMRFYYLMIQAINFIIHVLRSWIPHLEPIRAARQAFRVQCVSTIGTEPTNLYESLLLLS